MNYILVILSIISVFITILTQIFENWLYIKYINIPNVRKISGSDAARFLLEKNNIKNIKIKEIKGYMTDHYDAKNKEIQLSKKVYNSKTIGAVAIASREVCHAIQDKEKTGLSKLQRLLYISNVSTPIAYLTIVVGILFSQTKCIWVGIIVEMFLLLFQIVSLPFRIKASKKTLKELDYSHLLNSNELIQSKKVLNSYIISSIARLNTTLLHLFRLMSMIDGNNHFVLNKGICYFWIFVLSGFLGFVIETIWCFIKNKKIESRKGVIHEPLIPIYSISGLLIVIIVELFKLQSNAEIFIAGVIISSVIEFICSLLQEKIFGTKSWDYSEFSWNFHGRINLVYSILFGIVSLISYKFILSPFVNLFMEIKMTNLIISLTLYRFIYMIYDFVVSSIAVYRMKERRNNVKRKGIICNYIDEKYSDDFLKTIYANMTSVEAKKKIET